MAAVMPDDAANNVPALLSRAGIKERMATRLRHTVLIRESPVMYGTQPRWGRPSRVASQLDTLQAAVMGRHGIHRNRD
jgi:hypothetical protein